MPRPAGSTSFKKVKLSELNRLLKPEADVPVSSRFCDLLELEGKRIEGSTENLVAMASQADFQVIDLSKEELVVAEEPTSKSKKRPGWMEE